MFMMMMMMVVVVNWATTQQIAMNKAAK